jgi:RNase P/RNase MRP subunit POP5
MTVKEKRGRRRYIAFTVRPELTRDGLIASLRTVRASPYVVQCSEGWAIVRCSPRDVEGTIAVMREAEPSSVSLRTSGTLSALRERYPRLKELRPKRP